MSLFNQNIEYSYQEAVLKVRELLIDKINDHGMLKKFCREHDINYTNLTNLLNTAYEIDPTESKIRKYPIIVEQVFEAFGYEKVNRYKKTFFMFKK